MDTSEPSPLYQIVYSEAVKQRLRILFEVASTRGDGPAFAAALKDFDRRLRLFPQFGDPQLDLTQGGGQMRVGVIRPLSMRYGIHEDRRLVFCTAPPVLLPMDRPAAASDE